MTLAISLWNITELTCLLFFTSFLCALYLCLFLICLASGMLYGDALSMHRPGCWRWSGTYAAPPSRVGKPCGCDCPLPCDAKASRGLVCIFLLPSLRLSCSFTHDCILLVCQSSHMHVVSINPQDMLLGRPTFTLSCMNRHTRTTVFPPSRICSIFPQESCGIRPISFILPVSSCLALKCV